MKRFLFVCISCLLPLMGMAQEKAVDPKAKMLLNKAIEAFESKKGVVADFMMKIENTKNGEEESFPGKVILKGEKFKLQMQEIETYFDGKTECVYMVKEGEVTISHPEKEDLKDVNPILLMKSCATDYKMRYLGNVKVNGKVMEKVELYPNDLKSKYSIITLLIEKDTLQLNTISFRGKNGVTTQFYVTKMENQKGLADDLFVFNTKNHPNVEVVDLR